MNKLQHEFEAFDGKIRIDSEAVALRSKRDMLKKDMEEYFPEECKKYNIAVNKSDLRFILQGSYKIGTTIKTANVDMDYGCPSRPPCPVSAKTADHGGYPLYDRNQLYQSGVVPETGGIRFL